MPCGFIPLVAGMGGQPVRAVYLAPTWVLKVEVFFHSRCLELPEYEVVSSMIIILVK